MASQALRCDASGNKSKVRITTQAPTSQTLEGTLHTADPITNLVMLISSPGTAPAQSFTGTVHVIPISQLTSAPTILSLPPNTSEISSGPFSSALPPIGPLEIRALRAREEAAVRALQQKEQNRGPKGIGKDAQDIFDALARTMPIRWHGTGMVVSDSVLIEPPYRVADCRSLPGVEGVALTRVRKVLEMERNKLDLKRTTIDLHSTPPALPKNGLGVRKGG
ncbi:MAG: hypothetical protein Q9227_002354 [Pyrenula ochraceoflavens]